MDLKKGGGAAADGSRCRGGFSSFSTTRDEANRGSRFRISLSTSLMLERTSSIDLSLATENDSGLFGVAKLLAPWRMPFSGNDMAVLLRWSLLQLIRLFSLKLLVKLWSSSLRAVEYSAFLLGCIRFELDAFSNVSFGFGNESSAADLLAPTIAALSMTFCMEDHFLVLLLVSGLDLARRPSLVPLADDLNAELLESGNGTPAVVLCSSNGFGVVIKATWDSQSSFSFLTGSIWNENKTT